MKEAEQRTESGPRLVSPQEMREHLKKVDRRLRSLVSKMEELHGSSDEVKRYVAYATVVEQYQQHLQGNLIDLGLYYVSLGDGDEEDER